MESNFPEPQHPPVGGRAVMASHYPSSPGFQLNSSHLLQSQQEALSAASPTCKQLSSLSFLPFPGLLTSSTQTAPGKPLQPTSTGNSQVCHPLSLHYWSRSLFLVAFLSEASSQLSSHGTVSSIRIILFTSLRPCGHIRPQGCLEDLGKL